MSQSTQGQSSSPRIVNGVNVTELSNTINAVKVTPGIARFKFHLRNNWIDGAHNRSAVDNFSGGGQDIVREKTFTLEADEHPMLLGRDLAPNPVEYLLEALTACVTTSMVCHAAARGVAIEEIESYVEGDIDLRGFLGLDKNVRNGFQNIRMNFKIKADATDKEIQEIVNLGPTFSPVYDSVTRGVPVTVKAEKKGTAQAA
jgi:uncharacterized OsmC-like protein